jgi:hypothetical protein
MPQDFSIAMWLLASILVVIGLFVLLAFFVTRALALATNAALAHFFARKAPLWLTQTSFFLVLLLLLVIVPLRIFHNYQIELYENAIPAKLELGKLIYHDGQSGLREGCGEAIFELAKPTVERIKKEGLIFFDDVLLGRDGDSYHDYAPWQATPRATVQNASGLFRGSWCIKSPPVIWSRIRKATQVQSSYFTTGNEQDIVVIPELGIVVFSYDG